MNSINYTDLIINSIILIVLIIIIIIEHFNRKKINTSIKMIMFSNEYPIETLLLIMAGCAWSFLAFTIISILYNLNILTIK